MLFKDTIIKTIAERFWGTLAKDKTGSSPFVLFHAFPGCIHCHKKKITLMWTTAALGGMSDLPRWDAACQGHYNYTYYTKAVLGAWNWEAAPWSYLCLVSCVLLKTVLGKLGRRERVSNTEHSQELPKRITNTARFHSSLFISPKKLGKQKAGQAMRSLPILGCLENGRDPALSVPFWKAVWPLSFPFWKMVGHPSFPFWKMALPPSFRLQDKVVWKRLLSGLVRPFKGFLKGLPDHQTTLSWSPLPSLFGKWHGPLPSLFGKW